jgi:hypothetical protein
MSKIKVTFYRSRACLRGKNPEHRREPFFVVLRAIETPIKHAATSGKQDDNGPANVKTRIGYRNE